METDENGVLTDAELKIAWGSAKTSWGYVNDFVSRGCRAVAQAQRDHDVAVVKEIPNPYADDAPLIGLRHSGADIMRNTILAALKAGEEHG